MEPKRGKYDTNPLDEKEAAHAEESWGSSHPGAPTEEVGGATRDIGRTANEAARRSSESEAPTRRINDQRVTSYPSVFVPPTYEQSAIYQPPRVPPPNVYQPPPMPVTYKPESRKVAGLGIPEKWAVILPYLPLYLAMVASIVELLLVPRTETRVRFHAAQGLALQIGITTVSTVLTFAGLFSGRYTGAGLFSLATSVFLVISMVRVWKGKPLHIAPLDEPTKWLDQKIKPRK